MYRLSVKLEFSAAHYLREYQGKCESLHGHNWKVEAVIAAKKAGKQGLVVDFHVVKKALKEVMEGLDHKYLNELTYFKKHNPTSENLAKFIFVRLEDRLRPSLRQAEIKGGALREVTVWESDNCSAAYSK
ncbi:MAG: 6-carboxytetrahydropterin synthase QueD [Omnitrophica WOR_2 bacterium RIFCSPHIGHO2_02_FULL_45_21]|nr:MAG: 6-carboxytetrahydropterin synthase QueD [Omnitrophica WOR_2 bacterium RIFCSPHIGHO2_02_FULL_45_21]